MTATARCRVTRVCINADDPLTDADGSSSFFERPRTDAVAYLVALSGSSPVSHLARMFLGL